MWQDGQETLGTSGMWRHRQEILGTSGMWRDGQETLGTSGMRRDSQEILGTSGMWRDSQEIPRRATTRETRDVHATALNSQKRERGKKGRENLPSFCKRQSSGRAPPQKGVAEAAGLPALGSIIWFSALGQELAGWVTGTALSVWDTDTPAPPSQSSLSVSVINPRTHLWEMVSPGKDFFLLQKVTAFLTRILRIFKR